MSAMFTSASMHGINLAPSLSLHVSVPPSLLSRASTYISTCSGNVTSGICSSSANVGIIQKGQ
jgi:hypothetical protein